MGSYAAWLVFGISHFIALCKLLCGADIRVLNCAKSADLNAVLVRLLRSNVGIVISSLLLTNDDAGSQLDFNGSLKGASIPSQRSGTTASSVQSQ